MIAKCRSGSRETICARCCVQSPARFRKFALVLTTRVSAAGCRHETLPCGHRFAVSLMDLRTRRRDAFRRRAAARIPLACGGIETETTAPVSGDGWSLPARKAASSAPTGTNTWNASLVGWARYALPFLLTGVDVPIRRFLASRRLVRSATITVMLPVDRDRAAIGF